MIESDGTSLQEGNAVSERPNFFSFFFLLEKHIFVSISLRILILVFDNELSLVVHGVEVPDVASDLAWCRRGQHLARATCFGQHGAADLIAAPKTREKGPEKCFLCVGKLRFLLLQ